MNEFVKPKMKIVVCNDAVDIVLGSSTGVETDYDIIVGFSKGSPN